ncbi:MAG: hypothetical protein HYZ28_08995 [Myxococcales bacterium]|nr:hypothetical protein [Myxococcales bacterium]
MNSQELTSRFALTHDPESSRRTICGTDVIIHCHHYNSRIQRTIEGAAGIDGKKIFVRAAESVFSGMIRQAIRPGDSTAEKWEIAAALYSHLGYGKLDLSSLSTGLALGTQSHFVEGWNAGFPERKTPVCSLTSGYLQAAHLVVTGDPVSVREEECMVGGAKVCRFAVNRSRTEPAATYQRRPVPGPTGKPSTPAPSNIDQKKITEALVAMPIHGNNDGLLPAFNVYLANTPIDFYNLACFSFIEEMDRLKIGAAAKSQLMADSEYCGINTFQGIISSPEWAGLVGPMIKDQQRDTMHGIVAVSNALGWGNWQIVEHTPAQSLRLESRNGYEATGFLELRGKSQVPSCLMLTGAAAGIMELVYGEGSERERFGQFASRETTCRSCGGEACGFEVTEAS